MRCDLVLRNGMLPLNVAFRYYNSSLLFERKLIELSPVLFNIISPQYHNKIFVEPYRCNQIYVDGKLS